MLDLLKLICLIFLIILSVIMYFKGIKKIKENNDNLLLFSWFPSFIIKALFIQEEDYNYLYEKRKKELDIQLNKFDEKLEKNNKMQIIFYTFFYIIL